MSVIIGGKAYDLPQLKAELAAAGIVVPALGSVGDTIITYNGAGDPVSLPAGAASVVASHVAPAPPTPADYGGEGTDAYRAQLASGVQNLRDYLALGSPTPAQSAGALKLCIRLVLFLARQQIR